MGLRPNVRRTLKTGPSYKLVPSVEAASAVGDSPFDAGRLEPLEAAALDLRGFSDTLDDAAFDAGGLHPFDGCVWALVSGGVGLRPACVSGAGCLPAAGCDASGHRERKAKLGRGAEVAHQAGEELGAKGALGHLAEA